MLKPWTKILPFIFIEWYVKRHCASTENRLEHVSGKKHFEYRAYRAYKNVLIWDRNIDKARIREMK